MKDKPKTIAILGQAQTVADIALRKVMKINKSSGSAVILDYTGRGAMILGDSNKMGLLNHHVFWYDLANRQRPVALFTVPKSSHFR